MSPIDMPQLWNLIAVMRAGCIGKLKIQGIELEMSPLGFEVKETVHTDVIPSEREPSEAELLFHSAGPVSDDVPAVPDGLLNGIRIEG